MIPNKTRAVVTLIVITFLSACESERLNQFSTFAAAGSQYVAVFHQVVAQAGSAMIASDSATLAVARNQAGEQVQTNAAEFRRSVAASDRLLQTYLLNLQKIDEHATLLGSYFDAISALTHGKAGDQATTGATDLLNAISSFNPEIANAKFGSLTVQDLVKKSTPLVIAHFEVKALDNQLKKAAPVIDEALSLQEAAIAAIGEEMKSALGATLEVRESTDIIEPYVATGKLPTSWNANRESFIRAKVTIENVEAAKAAITKLHTSFKQLVENKDASIDLTTLLTEISKMAGFANAISSSSVKQTQ